MPSCAAKGSSPMKTRFAFLIPVLVLLVSVASAADKAGAWTSMFNGKDLSGWKATEEGPGSFTVEDGVLKIGTGRASFLRRRW